MAEPASAEDGWRHAGGGTGIGDPTPESAGPPGTPRSRAVFEFLRFGLVGLTGLLVDIATLDGYLAAFGDRPYSGQAIGWAVSVTTNWWLNRRFTFTDGRKAPALRQWAQFVAVNSAGAVINYGVYSGLVSWVPLYRQHPSLAVAAGVAAGLALNFTGSRSFVFKRNLLR